MFPKPHHQTPPHSQAFPYSCSAAPTPPSSTAASHSEAAMSPYVLEIPDGNDIVEAISRFCNRRNTGLHIMQVYGSVADVTLRQSPSVPVASLTFRGRFEILSASATILPRSTSSFSVPDGLIITLAGQQGQIFGGFVSGALISSGIVYVIAGSLNNPSYHQLPSEDLGFSDVEEDQSPPISSVNATAFDFRGLLPSYRSHSALDIRWSLAARQPPPPHHQY